MSKKLKKRKKKIVDLSLFRRKKVIPLVNADVPLNNIIHADVLDGLAQLPADWFHVCITSPPYWRLRSYPNVAPTTWRDGQTVCLGAEADPDSFTRHLVEVFDGVRRVLRPDGVLFVNLGETYASGKGTCNNPGGGDSSLGKDKKAAGAHPLDRLNKSEVEAFGLQPGDRCGIPERFALAMQAAGWTWRDTIIWAKRSPMPMSRSGWRWMRCRVKVASNQPQSVGYGSRGGNHRDNPGGGISNLGGAKWADCPGCKKCLPNDGWILRKGRFCTTAAHEPILMFVRGKEYFCDSEAASEQAVGGTPGNKRHKGATAYAEGDETHRLKVGLVNMVAVETRLPRSVWLLSNEPNKEKHFAAYPTQIPKRLIEMATSKGGCCAECGTPWVPMVQSERVPTRPGEDTKVNGDGALAEGNRDPQRHVARTKVLGYRTACECQAGSVPCRVLDPFGGTGTTAQVADHLGRHWTLIEASADYLPIAERRVKTPPKWTS